MDGPLWARGNWRLGVGSGGVMSPACLVRSAHRRPRWVARIGCPGLRHAVMRDEACPAEVLDPGPDHLCRRCLGSLRGWPAGGGSDWDWGSEDAPGWRWLGLWVTLRAIRSRVRRADCADSWVRCLTKSSRARSTPRAACRSVRLIGTKRMSGHPSAAQIAAHGSGHWPARGQALRASSLLRLTKGLT
jgi:hypothetical protein